MKRIILAFVLLLILAVQGCPALSEELQTLTLPASLKQIEEKAFYGDTSLEKVSVPDGTTHIGSYAFANSSIREIELPESLEYIARDAFSGCEDLVAYVPSGSYAQDFCYEAGIAYILPALPVNNFSYVSIDDGSAYKITRYLGTATEVVIPETIKGKPVTALGSYTFYTKDRITSVYLPDSINLIEANALSHCPNLQKVVLPKGLQALPSFYGCPSLEEIVWPENYTSFESFFNCQKLKSFRIPDGMTYIPSSAFQNCYSLTDIHIPGSITQIKYYAFQNCSSLTGIIIPEGVKQIGDSVFENCTNLASVSLPGSLESLGASVFANCPNLTLQVVGNSYAESYCIQYEKRHTSVGTANIDHLFETTLLEDGSCEITKFNGNHPYLKMPASIRGIPVSSIGDDAFYGSLICNVVIPEGVTRLGSNAFQFCRRLEEISLPSTLQSIGKDAFDNSAVRELILPENATDLSPYAFSGCTELINVVLPTGLTEIKDGLFTGCSKLENIDIPTGVTRIGGHAFRACSMLQSPVLPDVLQEIGEHAFSSCPGITELIFPESLTKIGSFAYAFCHNLYLAIIPASVQELGEGAFRESEALTVVTERNSAALEHCKDEMVFFIIEPNAESDFTTTKISDTACRITGYKGTDTDVFLPETIGGLTVQEISASAFMGKKIESISILNSVTAIGQKAFMNCTALRYAAISDGVTDIADNAFDGCTNLENIYIITLGNS